MNALESANRLRGSLRVVLANKGTTTFHITWDRDDVTYLALISGLLSDACQQEPRQCWFTQAGDGTDLDRPRLPASGKRGITIHGPDAYAISKAFSAWFLAYSTELVPAELAKYNQYGTQRIIWVEIGPGSPWKEQE
jgi:hypothetical protein